MSDNINKPQTNFTFDKSSQKKSKLKKNTVLITAGLAILVLVSVAQAVQSATILNKVNSMEASSLNSPALPSNVSDLPDMVGGC